MHTMASTFCQSNLRESSQTNKTIWQGKILIIPAGIYLLSRREWCCSGVFIINFKQISYIVLLFPLLNLIK